MQRSWSVLLKLIALASALLFGALPSFAHCFQTNPTVACELFNSDAVFVGTVISGRAAPPRGAAEPDGLLYRLSVQELFRGPRTKTIEVFTENSSGSFPLDVAEKYLLFADEKDGRLTIANCGNSSLQSKAEEAIRELRRLEIPKDAAIEGRISFSGKPDPGTHMPGMQIIIHGDKRTFKATSDPEGSFHIHVPPGKYSAEVAQIPNWNIVPSTDSYDNPNNFDARKRHCSRLQFVANSK
jgi:hypothetical protein